MHVHHLPWERGEQVAGQDVPGGGDDADVGGERGQDLRGVAAEAPTAPAPRLGELAGKRILLLDNNKLSVSDSAYGVIAETLCDGLAQAVWSRTMVLNTSTKSRKSSASMSTSDVNPR